MNKKLQRAQCQIVLRMLLRLFWQCVRNSIETTSQKTATSKREKKKSLKGAQSHKAPHTDIAKGNESGEGQSVTGVVFVLINHKVDVPVTASVGTCSASTTWSMSYWTKLTLATYKYVRQTFSPFSSEIFKHNCSFSKPNALLWIGNLPNDHQFSTQTTKQLKISCVCMLSWFAVSSPWSPLLSSSLWFMILISSRAFFLGCMLLHATGVS